MDTKIAKSDFEDRISNLPDPILHHILSFLNPVEVVRTSLVSTRWRHLWVSAPTMNFFIQKNHNPRFVRKCLNHRRKATLYSPNSAVAIFKFQNYLPVPEFGGGLCKWLCSSTIQNSIKELELTHFPSDKQYLHLPPAVLNGRSLARLELMGFIEISDSVSINLPSLKSICLSSVRINDQALHNVFEGCSFIRKCKIQSADLRRFRISSPSLERFDADFSDCETVGLEFANLQDMDMRFNVGAHVDFSYCRDIRRLLLHLVCDFGGADLKSQISNLPFLEDLEFFLYVDKLEDFELGSDELASRELSISSQSLKRFGLNKAEWKIKFRLVVTIEAPNLDSFTYRGDPKLSILTKKKVDHSRFFLGRSDANSFRKLATNLFANINCSWNTVYLYLPNQDKALVILQIMKKIYQPKTVPNLKELKIMVFDELTRHYELVKSGFLDFSEN